MSSLKGHYRITAAASSRVAHEYAGPVGYVYNGVADLAVMRDLYDAVSLGHWMNHGQTHHFMREFGTQSPRAAYEAACDWIRSQAHEAANLLAKLLRESTGESRAERVLRHRDSLRPVYAMEKAAKYDALRWQCLGNAIHAVEDSFARGHVVRDGEGSEDAPGPIIGIRRYMGGEKDYHEEMDDLWAGPNGDGFSLLGKQAIHAVAALLRMVIRTAYTRTEGPVGLDGWSVFQDQYLRASPKLSDVSDRALDLILKRCRAIIIGGRNFKTLDFDEDGLADDLVKIVGDDATWAREVFEWLDESFNSDADDVAELYVNALRAGKGPGSTVLSRDPGLILRLIKVLDEGYTSAGEAACIKYLRGLQNQSAMKEFTDNRAKDYLARVKNWKPNEFTIARKPNAFLTLDHKPRPTTAAMSVNGPNTPVAVVLAERTVPTTEAVWLYLELKTYTVVHEDARGP